MDFDGSFHAILRHLCHAKFMAVPDYTKLKMKLPGPNDIIMVSSSFEQAYTCSQQHFKLNTVFPNSTNDHTRLRRCPTRHLPTEGQQRQHPHQHLEHFYYIISHPKFSPFTCFHSNTGSYSTPARALSARVATPLSSCESRIKKTNFFLPKRKGDPLSHRYLSDFC